LVSRDCQKSCLIGSSWLILNADSRRAPSFHNYVSSLETLPSCTGRRKSFCCLTHSYPFDAKRLTFVRSKNPGIWPSLALGRRSMQSAIRSQCIAAITHYLGAVVIRSSPTLLLVSAGVGRWTTSILLLVSSQHREEGMRFPIKILRVGAYTCRFPRVSKISAIQMDPLDVRLVFTPVVLRVSAKR
jgi:hypothetical protein